jgi:ribose-phosphate pyrophosphokinase
MNPQSINSQQSVNADLMKELLDLIGVTGSKKERATEILKILLDPHPKQIFVIGSDKKLGNKIASLLKIKPTPYQIKIFSDGENLPHQIETVAEKDVYIIFTSEKGAAMAKWKDIYLRFVKNVKWGRPYRITAVLPEWYGQRADVENFPQREAPMSSLFAELLEAAGADRIIVCKLHNAASSIDSPPMMNIDTTTLIIKKLKVLFSDLSKIAIGSADIGGAKYARYIASCLNVPVIITDKVRNTKSGKTQALNIYDDGNISPDIDTIIFVDDLIQTFGSLKDGAALVQGKFPHIKNYIAVATHPDFVKTTLSNIENSLFNKILVADTIPISKTFISRIKMMNKELIVVSVAKLIARVIDNLHNNVPVSDLWTNGSGN